MRFLLGGVFIFFEGCSEVIMHFLFFLLHLLHVYRSCDHLTYIVLIFGYIYIYIYIYVDVCYSPIFTCVISFLSLCT